MTDDMPRKLPLYVTRQRTRHGKMLFYFRRGKGPRTPLPDPKEPDFLARYNEALAALEPAKKKIVGVGSLAWLIDLYRDSGAYRSLSAATRKQRDNIFKGVVEKAGHHAYSKITRKVIAQGREDRRNTPAQARNFLDAMRGLFRWALEAQHVEEDPTATVRNPSRPKGAGFEAWSEDDVAAFEDRWREGTRERVWLHVLLYTGLRRGDAVKMGRQHVKDGVATIKTAKTGMQVSIPILPELERTLAIGPTGDLAFIVGDRGQPLTKETFGNKFRVACREAGLTGKSAHGLRKLGATRAAEHGLTVNELEALFGWSGGTMASHYTRTADRKKLAKAAAEKIRNAQAPNQLSDTPNLKKVIE